MEGEVFEMAGEDGLREPEVLVRDPRKVDGFKRMSSLRPGRNELYEVKYEVRVTLGISADKWVLICRVHGHVVRPALRWTSAAYTGPCYKYTAIDA